MNAFKKDQLVRHNTRPEWGLGRVLMTDGPKVHVFFSNQPGSAAQLLKTSSDGSPLVLAKEQTDPWLDNLPAFEMKDGRLTLSQQRMTLVQAVEHFHRRYPLGFQDQRYLADERDYKWEAHELYVRLLGNGLAEQSLSRGHIDALAESVFDVATKTNLLHPNWDKAPLKDALRDRSKIEPYLRSLIGFIGADEPTQPLFEAYVDALAKLPQPGSPVVSWPVTTIMPYLARPDRHMLLRPSLSQQAASRFGFELNYDPYPNWRTYKSQLDMSAHLLRDLRPKGARDYIDIQSFIWIIART